MTKSKDTFKPVLQDSEIRWYPRYSSTMEDDEMGRWARVAHAGRFDSPFPLFRGKIAQWEIAWVKKLENKFVVHPQYPYKGIYVFDTLEEAQKDVEETFRWFIKRCVGKIKLRKIK